MIIEMNVRYAVKPGKEKRVLEILKDIRSEDADRPHEVLRKELLLGGYSVKEKGIEYGSDHHDCASKIWAFLETLAKVRVHFWA
ncbi:MAG: hypothetical protein HQ553_05015 [Chloroflexi bacterium]|nr:hypothetical protein [Chloroflexota bacterium]